MNRRSILSAVIVVVAVSYLAPAAEPAAPRIFQSDGRDLLAVKRRLAAGEQSIVAAVAELRSRADQELKTQPPTVVNKPQAPPNGDKHDYVSMAPYFWPDPSKPDGLPYIRRDGRINPERNEYDRPLLGKMSQAVGTLGLAYYLTDDERYAVHAAQLMRVWFLDAATRMNPNLNQAQFIRGVNDGRGIGIIDSVSLLSVVDSIGLIRGSKAWSDADHAGVIAWFRDYLHWLRTSRNGKEEAAAANNHGSWYDVQVATFALFVGEGESGVKKLLEESQTKRIARQIEPDGREPLELKRTKAFDYSQTNLRALFALATLGDRVGVDLWRFETPDGRGIRKALDWLIPFATGEKKWEHEQITGLRGASLATLLRRAAVAYRDERYERLVEKLTGRRESGTMNLLYPNPR
jgi:hypothetical protein